VLPEAQLPWAMNGWAPVTSPTSAAWFFSAADHHFSGCGAPTSPRPGWATTPSSGSPLGRWTPPTARRTRGRCHDPAAPTSSFRPYEFSAQLLSYGTRGAYATLSVAPTAHGAVFRFTFPPVDTRLVAAGQPNAEGCTLRW
jgi:putative alpha-1,2-mannosidase